MAKKKKNNEESKENKEEKQKLVDFKGQRVPENELDFWKTMMKFDDSFLESVNVAKKTNFIDDAIAQGTVSTYMQLERSTYLNDLEISAFSIFQDFPVVNKIILRHMFLKRHRNGQHQDKLLQFYEMHSHKEEESKWRKHYSDFAKKIKSKLGMI